LLLLVTTFDFENICSELWHALLLRGSENCFMSVTREGKGGRGAANNNNNHNGNNFAPKVPKTFH